MEKAGDGKLGRLDLFTRKTEPAVISVPILLEGIEDADADALKATAPELEVLRRAATVALSYKSTCISSHAGGA